MRRLVDSPYLLLGLAAFMWAGNVVASRLAVGEISPMLLTTLRWIGVCAILAGLIHRQFRADWPQLRTRLGYIFLMGAIGFTAFNAAFYVAAYYTSAVNIGIVQGAIPVFAMLVAFLVHGTRVSGLQAAGVLVTIIGVLVIATKGEVAALAGLSFNFGDLLILLASLFYGIYAVALTARPQVFAFSFLAALAGAALIASLPGLVTEIALGKLVPPTLEGWMIVAYITLFPSLLSQACFIRGVEIVGPGRAGISVNLVPAFSAVLGVVFLREPFHVYHAAALALVLGGLVLAERGRPATLPAE